ncbi:MAG: helix-turn-helix domain-containing protein [Methylotenera sp.]|nr:helix-turn-helix domain-containing protein [Flavobacterium sp.]
MLTIKELREEKSISQSKLAEMLNVSLRTVQNYEGDQSNIPLNKLQKIYKSLDVDFKNEFSVKDFVQNKIGVPFYDIDFTSSFLEITNNQNTQPDSYISHPFFTGCDYVVRNSGQSMAKVICHGDAIGLIEVKNWREFFPFGEIYAIVTNDNFRMIKVITKGESDDYYTLISKPTDSKKDEFPPQQIKRSSIISIFKVQASSHLF